MLLLPKSSLKEACSLDLKPFLNNISALELMSTPVSPFSIKIFDISKSLLVNLFFNDPISKLKEER